MVLHRAIAVYERQPLLQPVIDIYFQLRRRAVANVSRKCIAIKLDYTPISRNNTKATATRSRHSFNPNYPDSHVSSLRIQILHTHNQSIPVDIDPDATKLKNKPVHLICLGRKSVFDRPAEEDLPTIQNGCCKHAIHRMLHIGRASIDLRNRAH